jgi:sporulation protein YlmC with PRC-barrel domain
VDKEIAKIMKKITDLKHLKIYTEDGKPLGRVFDLRSPGLPDHGLNHKERIIGELVYGKLGLLESLGLRQAKATTVNWDRVVEIKDGRITVNDNVKVS